MRATSTPPSSSGLVAPAIGAWLPARGVERPIGHADARQVEHRGEMEGESGAARVVAAGGIGERHLRVFGEQPQRGIEQRAFAQREQAGLVGRASRADGHGALAEPPVSAHLHGRRAAALARPRPASPRAKQT
jgi:hypothetical protein